MTQSDSPLSGLLIVDKPGLPAGAFTAGAPVMAGAAPVDEGALAARLFTSHDVVQRVRRLAHQRRIGHTGTLDPMASGVLVLCLGWATRLVEYYQGHDKSYLAQVTLGFETDTYDLLGRVVAQQPVPHLTAGAIESALQSMSGAVLQRPPAYSALKQEGESLHRKARRGEVVEAPARAVTFHALELLDFAPPATLTLRVVCSAGAYVRSLAVDLGRALGTVATLSALRREAAGPFTLAQAHTLPAIEAAAAADDVASLLLAPGHGLHLPTLTVDAESERRLGQGQRVTLAAPAGLDGANGEAQARDAGGRLLGIVRGLQPDINGPALWQADKWFAA